MSTVAEEIDPIRYLCDEVFPSPAEKRASHLALRERHQAAMARPLTFRSCLRIQSRQTHLLSIALRYRTLYRAEGASGHLINARHARGKAAWTCSR